MNTEYTDLIDTAARILRDSRSVLFVTGAGISADSGVPTYRGIGGLYEIEETVEGIPIEEILSGSMFQQNPELTWKYLGEIARAADGATFNRAHEVIAKIEQLRPRVWTLTQNVDGFHTLAGSKNVIEIHGNMRSLICTGCGARTRVERATDITIPPYCSKCAAILRPDVVLFGEMLPEQAIQKLMQQVEQGFDVVISVGTSGLFPYIQEPFVVARKFGIPTFEINPDETLITNHADYHIPLGAAAALDEIWKRFKS